MTIRVAMTVPSGRTGGIARYGWNLLAALRRRDDLELVPIADRAVLDDLGPFGRDGIVVPGGFCWQGKTYDSLSTIAKKVAGITWNGPRFFGLRSKKQADADTSVSARKDKAADVALAVPTEPVRRRVERQSSLRSLSSRSEASA